MWAFALGKGRGSLFLTMALAGYGCKVKRSPWKATKASLALRTTTHGSCSPRQTRKGRNKAKKSPRKARHERGGCLALKGGMVSIAAIGLCARRRIRIEEIELCARRRIRIEGIELGVHRVLFVE